MNGYDVDQDQIHKWRARDADARIVARGGRSIFGIQPIWAPPVVVVPEIRSKFDAIGRVRRKHRPARWIGEELDKARLAYMSDEKLYAAARTLGTSVGRLCSLAKLHGWPKRPRGPRPQRKPGDGL